MTVLVSDSFNRANSTTGLGTTDSYNGGNPTVWQYNASAVWGINSNQAYWVSGGTTDHAIAYVDAGASDVVYTLTIAAYSGSPLLAMRFNKTDGSYLSLQIGANNVNLYDYNGSNTWTKLASPIIARSSTGDTYQVILQGSSITVNRNGTQLFTATSTRNQTSTLFGMEAQSSQTNRFDNLEIDSVATSGTTYIGSGTSQGTSSATSNETLILSGNATSQGTSSATSTETQIGASTTYSGSATSQGTSSALSSEKLILRANGTSQGVSSVQSTEHIILSVSATSQGQSSATSSESVILSASGVSQGQSSATSSETIVGHSTKTYSGSATSQASSSASSNERVVYAANGVSSAQSSATSSESVRYFVTGISIGQSSAQSKENFISVRQIVSHVTLQGSRELHVILQGNRQLHVVLQGGVDVPAVNQNFTLEAGTDKIIDIPNIVDSIAALDLTTCQGVYYEAKRGTQVISKNLNNGITVTSPTNLSIALVPADTHGFMGSFPHEVWCVDSNGKKCVLTKGNLTISPSYADVT